MCRKFHVVFKYLVLCFQGLTPPVLYQYSELLHDAQHMCVCVCVCVYSNACACLNIQSQSHPRIHVVVCTHALIDKVAVRLYGITPIHLGDCDVRRRKKETFIFN